MNGERTIPAGLLAAVAKHSLHRPAAELEALADTLRERFGSSLVALLYYGSCLRGGDPRDGLVDLYLVVDSYRAAYNKVLPALFNQLLPPNVYYLEEAIGDDPVRAKYAVVSLAQLRRGCSSAGFHGYFWGRFAQPVGLLYARDAAAADAVHRSLADAVLTFLGRTIPALPRRFDVTGLWSQALALNYRTELRAEKGGRGRVIAAYFEDYYRDVTEAALPALPFALEHLDGGDLRARVAPWSRRMAGWAWALRRVQGKLLSLARLVKALFTFQGGIDYIVWKLERHSGQTIPIDDKVRDHPLIYGWGMMWRLYRRGLFR